jgi:hypothetical protein
MARPESEVVLVSPWIEDVVLYPPLLEPDGSPHVNHDMRLSELLLRLARDYDIRIHVIVREQDARLAWTLRSLRRTKPANLYLREVPHLRAKLVVTEAFTLEMSADLLRTSLFRNVESCRVVANPHSSTRRLLQEKLGLAI